MKKVLLLVISMQILLVACNIDNSSINAKRDGAIDTIQVVNWIAENAIPIEKVDSIPTTNELKALYPVLKTKRIVALGDGTHGTSEFFKLKHRIIKQLVDDLDYSAIAMELPVDIGVHINNYIKTGKGNLDQLMGQTWWWHQSEEIKEFFIWMHDYNNDLPDIKKISFYGFDCQVNGDNTYQIFQYFKKVDTSYNEIVQPILDFMVEFYIDNYEGFTPYRIEETDKAIKKLNELLEINKDKYIANSSREEFLITKARINTFRGNVEMQKVGGGVFPLINIRDETNAKNIEIISEIEGVNSKVILWAHNGHITTDK
ncbi:MAG: erythromycin esterase family protein, partial [Bacteroidales bacterium]|nr:erythromycin esterase family protein [Bacteroidales bacterium]